jgi:uncharacterized BrkB/YihY/UPF0761 family membrane protein
MPKRIFWPVTLIVMGLVFMASSLGYFPEQFWKLWPLILVVVGLGGLLTSDREEWYVQIKNSSSPKKKAAPVKKAAAKTSKKTAVKKKSTKK